MTNLHAYFHLRNVSAFRQLLDARTVSGNRASDGRPGSGPRSWSQQGQGSTQMTQIAQNVQLDNNPNARDALGRTVLHLACADVAPVALEFTRALVGLPSAQLDVNAQDTESGWTALHRALYAGNLPAAILLLARNDIDTGIRDLEGMTAFDVYNATVEGTAPNVSASAARELLVWGSNRNATLGVGDADDRTYPEAIHITRPTEVTEKLTGSARFSPITVKHIAMSRLHTAVLTSEPRGNLEVCGFGGVGRLGTKQHAQYSLTKVSGLENQTITAVALGLDHTLALTQEGNVLSWGMNRFHQLGYVIEPADTTNISASKSKVDPTEAQIQVSPKRIIGPLRKEVVVGIAACKTASACWTKQDLYTWGTNTGQLGYPKGTQAWQVLPRKVAKVSNVEEVAISDIAMVCLVVAKDGPKEVWCFWNGTDFRIQFPSPTFPHRYQPPQVFARIQIAKITCSETAFAALTTTGEVFLFTLPDNPSSTETVVRPQKVWTLRRRVAAVHDIALGGDGTIIVCTASGHVFVHAPKPIKGAAMASGGMSRAHKYQRVTGLQRVVAVSANSTGGFAALRTDAVLKPLVVESKRLCEHIASVQPFMVGFEDGNEDERRSVVDPDEGDDEDEETEGVFGDVKVAEKLCVVVDRGNEGTELDLEHHLLHGADIKVRARGQETVDIPAHTVVLLARCTALRGVFAGQSINSEKISIKYSKPAKTVSISGCHPLSVLVLLNYLYTDNICAIWDRRVHIPVSSGLEKIGANPMVIRADMQKLAKVLGLGALARATETIGKRTPVPTLDSDFTAVFNLAQTPSQSIVQHDISLELADRSVLCHSVILRSRSPFFAAFFDEPEWTLRRWDEGGVISVDLKHLEWKAMRYVVRYMCCGAGVELFDDIDFVRSTDELIDFVFSVMAAANELMLEQLTEICSLVILRHITLQNCTSILSDASPMYAPKLKNRVHEYIAVNMECLLEKRFLDDVTHDTMKELAAYVRTQQAVKLPHTRSGAWITRLADKHKAWLDLQDFPSVVVRTVPVNRSPKISPSGPTSPKTPKRTASFNLLATPQKDKQKEKQAGPNDGDGMFAMDEERVEEIPKLELTGGGGSPSVASAGTALVWGGVSGARSGRIDMRSIMADEVAGTRATRSPTVRIAGFDGSTQPSSPVRTPQKDRARQLSQTVTPPASASTSWRESSSPAQRGAAPAVDFPNLGDSSRSRLLSKPSPSAVPKPGQPQQQSQPQPQTTKPIRPAPTPVTSPPQPAFPGLGPVIVPKRSVSVTETTKRRGAPDAWTAPPPLPSPPAGPSGSVSFSAIQQQQHAQKTESGAGKSKRSLKEIQEEERNRQEQAAREAEEVAAEFEFMQWWNAEEARVKKEMEAVASKGGGKRRGRGGGGGGGDGGGDGSGRRRRGKGQKGGGGNVGTPVAGSTG
ncbi:The BTB (BR-C, ttk and bab)/POZ (Pox virus and Zinc finger) domain [Ceratobasidium sp. AG-Ba]|nr:The BTB (BR-C, ttk and bab)/POZ (Pox virus and Zinc finger) domain [Ceratobasidium sp. AG-Ba]